MMFVSKAPTDQPTQRPTLKPTVAPSSSPTKSPSDQPTNVSFKPLDRMRKLESHTLLANHTVSYYSNSDSNV